MHEQKILGELLSRLETEGANVKALSLVCSGESLRKRLQKDVDAGLRREDVIGRSLKRLPLYQALDTVKIDVSCLTAEEAAEWILRL